MRQVSGIGGSLVLGGIVLCALWAVARDGAALLAVGGWYAVLGQFLAVAATMTLLIVLGALVVAVLSLPVLFVLRLTTDDGGFVMSRLTVSRLALAAAGAPRGLADTALRLADRVWKAAWWGCWHAARILRGGRLPSM
jgi:hypothetical protein